MPQQHRAASASTSISADADAGDSTPATVPLSPRRHQILSAAAHVTGQAGLRGLTHRAVDREAGLPEGSTSAYFRTRQALQMALASFVVSNVSADLASLTQELSTQLSRAAELTTDLLVRWLEEPDLLRSRIELSLEAARDPELAALLEQSRSQLIDIVCAVPTAGGAAQTRDRAEWVVAAADGILTAALLKPETDRGPFLRSALESLLTPLLAEDGAN